MGYLEFMNMNQEQTFQLILTLISKGIVDFILRNSYRILMQNALKIAKECSQA